MDSFRIKQGSTVVWTLSFFNDDGSTFSIVDASIASSIRDEAGNLITSVSADPLSGQVNQATVQVTDTSAWPVGQLVGDIKVQRDGLTVYSEDFGIIVLQSQTS